MVKKGEKSLQGIGREGNWANECLIALTVGVSRWLPRTWQTAPEPYDYGAAWRTAKQGASHLKNRDGGNRCGWKLQAVPYLTEVQDLEGPSLELLGLGWVFT